MAQYNPKSLHAEEFINHEEILETLKYAEENKHNIELIDSILEKARPQKTATGVHCAGLTHREASVLLACDIPEKIEEMYQLAEEIKLRSTATVLLCLRRCICPITVSTAVFTVRITRKPPYHPQKADAGRGRPRGYRSAGYGPQETCPGSRRRSGQQPHRVHSRVHQHHLLHQA